MTTEEAIKIYENHAQFRLDVKDCIAIEHIIDELERYKEQDLIRREDVLMECSCHYNRTCLGTGETCMECEHYSAEARYIKSIPKVEV